MMADGVSSCYELSALIHKSYVEIWLNLGFGWHRPGRSPFFANSV